MGYFIKLSNTWKEIDTCYKKENNSWTEINQAALTQYLNTNLSFFAGEISGDHTLSIFGQTTISGASCSFVAILDEKRDVTSAATWTIVSGGNYATLIGNGTLNILSNANNSTVVLSANYEGIEDIKTLTLTYKSGSSSHTESEIITDESGNTTTTTTTVTENSDGSSTSSTTIIVTDESGETIGSTEINTNNNSDGSYNSSTVNYDSEGNQTDGVNVSGDTTGNVNTQDVIYSGGTPVVTGYTIDTSGNTTGSGETVSNGLDTGLLVFDGHDWEAALKATIRFDDITPASKQFPILNVSSRGNDNKLDGAFFLVTRQNSGMGSAVYDENGTQQSTTTSSNPTLKWRIQDYLGGSLQNGVDFYYKNGTRPYYTNRFGSKTKVLTLTYKMKYTNSDHKLVTEIYAADGTTILSKPRSEMAVTFTRQMDDITFEIGKATNVSGTELKTKISILDFEVRKLT